MTKKAQLHQGRLLAELLVWKGISKAEFREAMNKSRQWVSLMIGYERIPAHNLIAICRKLNVSIDYFEGKMKLENTSMVAEPEEKYLTAMEIKDKRIMELLEENTKLKDKIIWLQEELLRFQALVKSH